MLTLEAPAKINLTLEITDILPGGFHRLDTIFQALELADVLEIYPAEQTSLEIIDEVGSGFTVESDENNLVFRSLRSLEAKSGRPLPCRFVLHKRIPAGGGLGGGSADGAAALKGVNELYNLGLDYTELHSIAKTLGADVAFGLLLGTARGLGKGDELTPLPSPEFLRSWTVLLWLPPFGLSTPQVYKRWDTLSEHLRRPAKGTSDKASRILQDISNYTPTDLCDHLANDLEPAALALQSDLEVYFEKLKSCGCEKVMLCGSGSTIFALFSPPSWERFKAREYLNSLEKMGKLLITGVRL
ncbi:4-(cytidine 5'-diphospho)-2-C-methyl-D-erythritol kinase [bacterium]|nr:4-(cytidine 5'-diphospho)-2-C-methyl-D-erythritol kinase [bacterium]